MNGRIRELAVEARLLTGWSVGEVEYQKFAELIVRECSRMADRWVDNDDNGKNYPSEMIKKHFGVEQ